MSHLKNDKERVFGRKKHFDYVPIYKMVNQTEKSIQEQQEHKQYVLDLANRDTQSIANSRKQAHLSLSRQESDAANKLYRMLKTTEGRTNHLFLNYAPREVPEELKPKLNKENSERVIGPPKSRFQELHLLNKKGLPPI
jgi:hypothetical protein